MFSSTSVHPRVCGEHWRQVAHVFLHVGSSPRVRGTPVSICSRSSRSRFIPACAGNTAAGHTTRGPRTVHPRVCGEHIFEASPSLAAYGSSPRVRGTHAIAELWADRERFIPACAGNTLANAVPASSGTVHPRVCGEHCGPPNRRSDDAGSSPRVRGTHPPVLFLHRLERFIPACAGNTPEPTSAAG